MGYNTIWKNRAKISCSFFKTKINIFNTLKTEMVCLEIVNIGLRPLVLTKFFAVGCRSYYNMGIYDSNMERKFPALLNPGEMLTIHPLSFDSLNNNFIKPTDHKIFHDPFLFFVFVDSNNSFHSIDVKKVLKTINGTIENFSPTIWKHLIYLFAREKLFIKYRWFGLFLKPLFQFLFILLTVLIH